MDVLIISSRKTVWHDLAAAFTAHSLQPAVTDSLPQALEYIRATPPTLVILDSEDGGITAGNKTEDMAQTHIQETRKTLTDILTINAMVQTAVVSPLSTEIFHDALEGFGVLTNLPPAPQEADIAALAQVLQEVCRIQAC